MMAVSQNTFNPIEYSRRRSVLARLLGGKDAVNICSAGLGSIDPLSFHGQRESTHLGRVILLVSCLAALAINTSCQPDDAHVSATLVGLPSSAATGIPQADCLLIEDRLKASDNEPNPAGVPAAPNATELTGKILCVQEVQASALSIKPDQPLYLIVVQVTNAQTVTGLADRLAGSEGSVILVFSTTEVSTQITGQTLRARVTYRGDEYGGAYWVEENLRIEGP